MPRAGHTSGLSTLKKDQIAERGARMARRDDREYREYLREEQRSQPGCPAREVVLLQRGQATSWGGPIAEEPMTRGRPARWRTGMELTTIVAIGTLEPVRPEPFYGGYISENNGSDITVTEECGP